MGRVFVYYNLHKKLWSVKALDGEHKGKVIARLPSLAMRDATFKVSEAGRQRVLKEKRKNVHAGVVGYMVSGFQWLPLLFEKYGWTKVRYNPYLRGEFFTDLGAVHTASAVRLNSDRTVDMLA